MVHIKLFQVGEDGNMGGGMQVTEYDSESRGNAGSRKRISSRVIVIRIGPFTHTSSVFLLFIHFLTHELVCSDKASNLAIEASLLSGRLQEPIVSISLPCTGLWGSKIAVYFFPPLRDHGCPLLGASGHHHLNCQKNVRTAESSGKCRRIS
jgi:hypothetical protein